MSSATAADRLREPTARPDGGGVRHLRLLPTAVAVSLALLIPVGLGQPAQAAARPLGRTALPAPHVTKVTDQGPGAKAARERVAAALAVNAAQARRARDEQHSAWPAGGTAAVPVTSPSAPGKAVQTGGLPVAVTGRGAEPASGQLQVRVLDRAATEAAHVRGVLLSARSAQPGAATVAVGYSAFASAYGGDWSGRLTLVQLPVCALTTPQLAECRTQTPLRSANDVSAQTLSAPVQLTAADAGVVVLAATAGSGESAKGSGNYHATELSASYTWQAGGSSGSFSWSYPLVPPVPAAGPTPSMDLGYDSGGVDGRTANTNNQGSQIGEGFSLSAQSYIERQYGSCDDDGHDGKLDLCWKYDNASLVLNGKSSELVKDDTTGVWRLANDDASTVTHATGGTNGDDNGEYWIVTTGEGVRYYFGLNKLPGAVSERTDSVWTAPIFGDDAGEPCNGADFASSSCDQAWRWNLDYVVDTHDNALSYWYTPETNYYRRNGGSTANAQYTRGGHLDKILYGQRAGTLFTATAADKVDFTYQERCTASDCSSLTDSTADNWPDVPYDAICSSGESDTDCLSEGPSFFTRKRLTRIDTSVLSGTGYALADTWALTQQFLDGGDIGDTSDQTLTLRSLQRTGKSGTDITLDPVTFTYQMRPNRVDSPSDDVLPLTRPRLETVTSEAGAITTVTLNSPECVRGSAMPKAEDDNADGSLSCYPQYWHVNGAQDATLDWFNKYRVLAVSTADPAGNNPLLETSYVYEGPAWHYNDSPFTAEDERTWSNWRGYRKVTAYGGDTDHPQSKSVTLYMQGMDGDKRKDGTTRQATVTGVDFAGLDVADITDTDRYAGQVRETIAYNGSTPSSVTVNDPWSAKTATQHKSYADIEAYYVRTGKTATSTYLTVPMTWRTTSTSTTYDSYGMAVKADNAGDTAKSGDETCTRTWYARNDAVGINSLVSRTRTVGQPCSVAETTLILPASSDTRGDVLSDTATVYDSATATAWSAAQTPTKGEANWTGRAAAYPATATGGERFPSSWQTTTRTVDDTLGRGTSVTDGGGNPTTTVFTPTDTGPLTKTVVTNPKTQKVTTFLDPVRGLPLRTYDANVKKTELTYDALARLTAVWLPDRSKDAGESASMTYVYHMARGSVPYVSTSTLREDGGYNSTYEIYDALLRPLQTQSPSPNGGRLLTDTRYDARGQAYETYTDVYDSSTAPNGVYARAEYGGAPTQHELTFDGLGRVTSDSLLVLGVPKWSTTTSYTGDSTATTAVTGGSGTRTIVDALGRTVERRDYASTSTNDTGYGGTAPAAGYTSIRYGYTRDGKQSAITGPDNAGWSYTFDLFGRQVSSTDPDSATSTTHFTSLDQVDWSQDSFGRKLLYGYDSLGRKTDLWQTDRTDPHKLAAWSYDTVAKGQLDTATRYDGGVGGKAYVKKNLAFDAGYRPTQTELDLPAGDPLVVAGAARTSYTFNSAFNLDGSLKSASQPAAGGLAEEWVDYGYNDLGMLQTVAGASDYLLATSYSETGQAEQLTLGTSDALGVKKAYLNNRYQTGTGRLTRSFVTDQTHAYMPQDLNYQYDDAGDVTEISDPATLGGTGKPDYQCYGYDGHQRLTDAWTPAADDCSGTARTAAGLGGAAPYWESHTYNSSGTRATDTTHTVAGDSTVRSCYTKPTQPHTLTATTTAADCTGVPLAYDYDSTGNTTKRPGPAGSEALTWNAESHLATLTQGTNRTDYLYDADNTLLIRRAAVGDGETVLYLGSTELHYKVTGGTTKTWATRSYSAGDTIAVRSNASGSEQLSFLASDSHGTASLALDAATQAVTKRYTTPFGSSRGSNPSDWPDDKRFLGKTADSSTGLTHIGSREYDPATGRFLSVDPLLETDKAQTLNGYSYGADNPATFADPTGTKLACGGYGDDVPCPKPPSPEPEQPEGKSYLVDTSPTFTMPGSNVTITVDSVGELAKLNEFFYGPAYSAPLTGSNYFASWRKKMAGILWDPKAGNDLDARELFFGWWYGGGGPFALAQKQTFRGGDPMTRELAMHSPVDAVRNNLLAIVSRGFTGPGPVLGVTYQDKGPEGPKKPWWYKGNAPRGIINDLLGSITNGTVGTKNFAAAVLGSYHGYGRVYSVDKSAITLEFSIKNISDANSATKIIPRSLDKDWVSGPGRPITETFTWKERWPLGTTDTMKVLGDGVR